MTNIRYACGLYLARHLFTLYYDYMCCEMHFTQDKVNFHATSGIPISLALPLAAAALWMIICKRPGLIWTTTKRA